MRKVRLGWLSSCLGVNSDIRGFGGPGRGRPRGQSKPSGGLCLGSVAQRPHPVTWRGVPTDRSIAGAVPFRSVGDQSHKTLLHPEGHWRTQNPPWAYACFPSVFHMCRKRDSYYAGLRFHCARQIVQGIKIRRTLLTAVRDDCASKTRHKNQLKNLALPRSKALRSFNTLNTGGQSFQISTMRHN